MRLVFSIIIFSSFLIASTAHALKAITLRRVFIELISRFGYFARRTLFHSGAPGNRTQLRWLKRPVHRLDANVPSLVGRRGFEPLLRGLRAQCAAADTNDRERAGLHFLPLVCPLWWNVPTSLPVCFRWSILKPDTTEVLLDSPSSHVLNLQ